MRAGTSIYWEKTRNWKRKVKTQAKNRYKMTYVEGGIFQGTWVKKKERKDRQECTEYMKRGEVFRDIGRFRGE